MFEFPANSIQLSVDEYLHDFAKHWESGVAAFLKLERRQHFIEPGNDSWEAFAAGDWARAMEIAERDFDQIQQATAQTPFPIRRLRVVVEPLTDYMRWELAVLRVRARAGEDIRVSSIQSLGSVEQATPLPEFTVLGREAVYEVQYDAEGLFSGARVCYDGTFCSEVFTQVADLCDHGQPILESKFG